MRREDLAARERRRCCHFHADDRRISRGGLDRQAHTARQSAAAERYDDDVHVSEVFHDLHTDRSGAGDHVGMVVGREVIDAQVPRELLRLLLGDVVVGAVAMQLCAVPANRIPLGFRGVGRREDHAFQSELLRRERDRAAVIAGRCGHDRRGLP